METRLADFMRGTPDGDEADAILRKCVHCGFCTATCPTYQLLGDELDGPRGRIYLIKEVLEGAQPTERTRRHLDRCLTCRSCETTCPSGVRYGRLVEIGRTVVESRAARPRAPLQRASRALLRAGLTRPAWFGAALGAGRMLRPLLPASLRDKVPPYRAPGPIPATRHERRVVLLRGCVQPAMIPAIDAATARVLDRLGIQSVQASSAGCCGSIRQHLNDPRGALDDMRRNVDAWTGLLDGGAEAIVVNASGCTVMVKEYGHLLRHDPHYAARAARVAAATRDLSEVVAAEIGRLGVAPARPALRVAFHPPCTLQHGLQIRGSVEAVLEHLGMTVRLPADSHLCCGSAGTYSLLEPAIARTLRDNKLAALHADAPTVIASANIGCIAHLQGGTDLPVRHWIELVDAALSAGTGA